MAWRAWDKVPNQLVLSEFLCNIGEQVLGWTFDTPSVPLPLQTATFWQPLQMFLHSSAVYLRALAGVHRRRWSVHSSIGCVHNFVG